MNVTKNLKNKKIFFLPVNTGYGIDNVPDDRLINFHRLRSGNEIYCAIIGNVVTQKGYGSNDYCLFMSNSNKWKQLSCAINDNNTLAGIQLSSTWDNYVGNKNFVSPASSDFIKEYSSLVKKIDTPAIDIILDDLEISIKMAISHGFKHIQLHAGHGYLFSLLLDEVFCENAQYAHDRLIKILDDTCNKVETSIRISLLTGIQKIDKLREHSIIKFLQLPFDYFDLSFGFYNINKHMIYPESKSMLTSRINKSLDIVNSNQSKNFIISGRSLKWFEGNLPANANVGICRDLIANPDYLITPEIECNLCGKCHYYSRGETHITCEKWSDTTLLA